VTKTHEKTSDAAIEMRGIRIAFGDVVANDDVDLVVRQGEIHALLGENGAGKSTLMRALSGLHQPDSGEIWINGTRQQIEKPQIAQDLGIGMVHQHFMLIDKMNVADNVVLGLPPSRAGGRRFFPDMSPIHKAIDALGHNHGLAIDAAAKVGDLSVAGQQRVEIIKVLYRGARILIMDEPTAVLTPQESTQLFGMLRSLASSGHTVIFISHKLHEVMAVTDRITVLRAGRVVGSLETAQTDEKSIARMMVGTDVVVPQTSGDAMPSADGPKRLLVDGVTMQDQRGVTVLQDVALSVAAGQIVGVAGVDGNGQLELADVIVGLQTPKSGTFFISDQNVTGSPPKSRIKAGLAHIPSDRHKYAVFDEMTVCDNAVAEACDAPRFKRFGLRKPKAIKDFARDLVNRYDVRPGNIDLPISSLSGGNQQKLVLARALSREPDLIVAVQPTRGLDLGASSVLQQNLIDASSRGAGVVLISTELDELLNLCHIIVVMFRGRVIGQLERPDFDRDTLGLMMAGQTV